MGTREIIEKKEGYSYGANDMPDGVSINQERRKETIVMDSEFIQLDDLEAYLRLPGDWPVTKVKFDIKERAIADENELIMPKILAQEILPIQSLDLAEKEGVVDIEAEKKKKGVRLKRKEEVFD